MRVPLLLCLLLLATAWACHPECTWQCDSPSCPARCHIVKKAPVCSIQCADPSHEDSCQELECVTRCVEDGCPMDACPMCETVCRPAHCTASGADCSPLCEAPEASWVCTAPLECPKPKCTLQCDQPSCQLSSGSWVAPTLSVMLVVVLVFIK